MMLVAMWEIRKFREEALRRNRPDLFEGFVFILADFGWICDRGVWEPEWSDIKDGLLLPLFTSGTDIFAEMLDRVRSA